MTHVRAVAAAVVLVVWSIVVVVVVEAFPNQAGACFGDGPAVSGRHLADNGGTRPVLESIGSHAIQLFVDGTVLSTTKAFTPVSTGAEHVLEIVSSQPFKGALIRIESSSSDFALVPMINAQVAAACGATGVDSPSMVEVQGVSHVDSALKNALSASFTTNAVDATFVVDVTIVQYNNATGSVYWYGQYTLATTTTGSGQQISTPVALPPPPPPTIAPKKAVKATPTMAPATTQLRSSGRDATTPTVSPTVTAFPTYSEPCWVCGSDNQRVVGLPNLQIIVLGEAATCGELQDDGASGWIPSALCPMVQDVARDQCGCESVVQVQNEPASAPMVPDIASPCYVCGVEGHVTNYAASITVNGTTATCFDWQVKGLAGDLSFDACRQAVQSAATSCACQQLTSSPHSPSQIAAAALEPTSSPFPTATAYPTYAEKCLVCSSAGLQVTKLDQVVVVHGDVGTCGDLERQGALGFVNPKLCMEAQTVAASRCGCSIVQAAAVPALAPAPGSIRTFAPTVTPFPTVSYSPTFAEKCLVCPDQGHPRLSNAVVIVDNLTIACGELDAAGRRGIIPPDLCPEAQASALSSCGCGT
jgi:hypothetical protein